VCKEQITESLDPDLASFDGGSPLSGFWETGNEENSHFLKILAIGVA
jgi:hypothetical protein